MSNNEERRLIMEMTKLEHRVSKDTRELHTLKEHIIRHRRGFFSRTIQDIKTDLVAATLEVNKWQNRIAKLQNELERVGEVDDRD